MNTFTDYHRLVALVLVSLVSLTHTLSTVPADAAIYRWDNGELITDMDAVPWARLGEMDLSHADLAEANLTRANSRP